MKTLTIKCGDSFSIWLKLKNGQTFPLNTNMLVYIGGVLIGNLDAGIPLITYESPYYKMNLSSEDTFPMRGYRDVIVVLDGTDGVRQVIIAGILFERLPTDYQTPTTNDGVNMIIELDVSTAPVTGSAELIDALKGDKGDPGIGVLPSGGTTGQVVTKLSYTAQDAGWRTPIQLGETSVDSYRGDRGKIAYDHSQTPHASADAEKNVNADWDSVSGDSQILNKPTIPSITGLATTFYVDQQDALKVDKITGKQLSTNDYTVAEKNKLTAIQAGAQVNILEGVQRNGTNLTIIDKKVNVIVPTTPSEVGAEPAITKNTGFNKNFGTTTGTVLEGRTFGTAANSAVGDFIQNQNSSAQSANMWISGVGIIEGDIRLTGLIKSTTVFGNNISLYGSNADMIFNTAYGYPYGGFKFNHAGSTRLSLNPDGTATFASTVNATQLQSTIATGTAPLTVNSTTMVGNLNAQLLGGTSLSELVKYVGTSVDANSMGTNTIGYTYSNNAPYYGSIIDLGHSGYSMQFNSSNGSSGLAYRSNNNYTWGNWQTIYTSGNLTNNLSTNYIPKWNGSSFVNSILYGDVANLYVGSSSNIFSGKFQILSENGDGATIKTTGAANNIPLFLWNSYTSGDTEFLRFYTDSGINKGAVKYNRATDAIQISSTNLELTGLTKISSTTQSTSPTTGALVVNGGIGVGGVANLGGSRISGDGILSNGAGLELFYTASNKTSYIQNYHRGGDNLYHPIYIGGSYMQMDAGNVGVGYATDQGYKLAVNGTGFFNGAVTASSFSGNGSNLTGVQLPITLTTNGTSGAATFSGGNINIPNYAASGAYVNISPSSVQSGSIWIDGIVSSSIVSAPIITTSYINFNSAPNGASISGSVSGSVIFNMPFNGAYYKKVIINLLNLQGSASWTFASSFSNLPVVLNTDGLPSSIVTSKSLTSITLNCATPTSGILILEGY